MSVTIENLTFHNGLTFRECTIPLASQGLVYLRGRNGHGKSTPWEILQHVFYGSTSRGLRKDGIVSLVPRESPDDPEGFLAEVVLRNPAGRWLVRQARSHPKYKTTVRVLKQVENEWASKWDDGACPQRLEDAQKLAGSLLGLQAHEFTGCMYLSQDAAHTLIEGTPSEKMQYISNLFGIDRYDRLLKQLTAAQKQLERTVDGAVRSEEQLTTIQARIAEIAPYVPTEARIAELRAAQNVVRSMSQRYEAEYMRARDALRDAHHRGQLSDAIAALNVDAGRFDALCSERERLRSERDDLTRRFALVKQRRALEAELTALPVSAADDVSDERLEKLRSRIAREREKIARQDERERLVHRLRSLPAGPTLREVEADIANARARYETLIARQQKSRNEIELLERQIAESDGICPTCLRPLDVAEAERLLAWFVSDRDARVMLIDERCDEIGRLSFELEMAEQRDGLCRQIDAIEEADIESLRKLLTRLEFNCLRLEDAQRNAIRYEQLKRQLDRCVVEDIPALLSRSGTVDAEIARIEAEYESVAKARALSEQMRALPDVDAAEESRRLGIAEEARRLFGDAVETLRSHAITSEQFFVEAQELAEQKRIVEEDVERYAVQRRELAVIEYAIQTAGKLKKRQLHKVVCAVRDVLPRFTSIMFNHEPETRFVVDAEDDESLDLLARRVVRGEAIAVPVKSFSGGEKQRLSVALVFTLHALLSPNKRPDLLILDEVDRGLDDRGVASLMALVRDVRQRYGTVIMTSHRPQIDGARFDQTWEVVKENEVSRLTINR